MTSVCGVPAAIRTCKTAFHRLSAWVHVEPNFLAFECIRLLLNVWNGCLSDSQRFPLYRHEKSWNHEQLNIWIFILFFTKNSENNLPYQHFDMQQKTCLFYTLHLQISSYFFWELLIYPLSGAYAKVEILDGRAQEWRSTLSVFPYIYRCVE